MTRTLVAVALTLGIPALQPDAARVLFDMRQALGGDTALAAVQSFSATASEESKVSEYADSVEWSAVLPDRVVFVRRSSTPWITAVTTDGFRGDTLIHRGYMTAPVIDPRDAKTPDERAAYEAETVRALKRRFSTRALALIGLAAVEPVDVSYEGQRTVAGRMCDVLRLRSSGDDYSATLAVDAATHLPARVTWTGAPISVTRLIESTVSIPNAPREVNTLLSMPLPVVTRPPGSAEHQIVFDDFKAVEGLTWPHLFTHTIDGRLWTTERVKKYKLNPKMNPKLFDPGHR